MSPARPMVVTSTRTMKTPISASVTVGRSPAGRKRRMPRRPALGVVTAFRADG